MTTGTIFLPVYLSRRTIENTTGVITSDNTIDTVTPPITAIANGCNNCAPDPTASANGNIPNNVASAGIKIGNTICFHSY